MQAPIGKMRHRISLEVPVRTRNNYGEEVDSWAVLATCWAWVRNLSGRELWAAQQVQSLATHRVTLRYRPGVTTLHRVDHRGQKLNIVHMLPDEEQNTLQLLCYEKAE